MSDLGGRPRSLLQRLEWAFHFLTILALMDPGLSLYRRVHDQTLDPRVGDPLAQGIFLGLYGITAALLVARRNRLGSVLRNGRWLWAFLALVAASSTWSMAPAVTSRRVVALIGTTAFAVLFVHRWEFAERLRMLAAAFVSLTIASYWFAIAYPDLAVEGGAHGTAYHAIFVQKNSLGRAMSLAIIFLCVSALRGRRRITYGFLAFMAFNMLIASRSAGALVMTCAAVAVIAMFALVRRMPRLAVPIVMLGVSATLAVVLAITSAAGGAFQVLDRDATLTGRTGLWGAMADQFWERPLLGHGYSGFWLGDEGPSGEVWRQAGWEPLHGHNGFLDLALDLGLVGLIGFLLLIVIVAVRLLRVPVAARDWHWGLHAVLLVWLTCFNVVESLALRQTSLAWVLFTMIIVAPPSAAKTRAPSSTAKRHREVSV